MNIMMNLDQPNLSIGCFCIRKTQNRWNRVGLPVIFPMGGSGLRARP